MNTILVTGGAGFIGSNFVRFIFHKKDIRIVVLDKLTYAGSRLNLAPFEKDPRFCFVKGDIGNGPLVKSLLIKHKPTRLVNFAAETHVDRSIEGPRAFIDTNIVGTSQLLEEARRYVSSDVFKKDRREFYFLHVSTDEVYGSLGHSGLFTEETRYAPNSPYSASKAAADHMVRAYSHTYNLPVLMTNCSNNYGPFQFPEKLIPLMILNAIEGKSLPIYGDGGNVRDWIYVEDHCAGVWDVLKRGQVGEKYNIGGNSEMTNLNVVDAICQNLDELYPASKNKNLVKKNIKKYSDLKMFVKDRPGHDRRYAIDSTKIKRELGWKPRHDFRSGIAKTVRWYLDNLDWCARVQKGKYNRERLGLK